MKERREVKVRRLISLCRHFAYNPQPSLPKSSSGGEPWRRDRPLSSHTWTACGPYWPGPSSSYSAHSQMSPEAEKGGREGEIGGREEGRKRREKEEGGS